MVAIWVIFRPPWLWAWLLAGGPVLFLALLGVIDGMAIAQIEPPASVETLARLADEMPPPHRLARIEYNETAYFVWIGQRPDTIVPMSGPPCYVLDRSGKLVDYSLDTGDDHHVSGYYGRAWDSPNIALDDALQFVANAE